MLERAQRVAVTSRSPRVERDIFQVRCTRENEKRWIAAAHSQAQTRSQWAIKGLEAWAEVTEYAALLGRRAPEIFVDALAAHATLVDVRALVSTLDSLDAADRAVLLAALGEPTQPRRDEARPSVTAEAARSR